MDESEKTKTQEDSHPLASKPLIFISHDTRDADLAEAFAKLLSSVSTGVLKSFRSSDKAGTQGIEYGTEWYPKLMDRLGCASDVVYLLTPRSLEKPWILYEAGVAKGRLNTPVLGVALGVSISNANVGPFAQFQNCAGDEHSLIKLVIQLISRIPGAEPDREVIQTQVSAFLTKIAPMLEKLEKASTPKAQKPASENNTVTKLFEEVKVMFQDLSSRREQEFDARMNERRAFETIYQLQSEVEIWKQRASAYENRDNSMESTQAALSAWTRRVASENNNDNDLLAGLTANERVILGKKVGSPFFKAHLQALRAKPKSEIPEIRPPWEKPVQ